MKKLLTILLFALMLFSLTACANNGAVQGGDTRKPSTAPQTSAPVEETGSVDNGNSPVDVSEPSALAGADKTTPNAEGGKILVAYLSRAGENYNVGVVEKGNTEIVAEMIAEITGGTLFKIETVTAYPVSYEETKTAVQEERANNARPALKSHIAAIEDYEVIFIGYPIWFGGLPMAMVTFLEEYDFTGKTIIPFCTHGGSGLSGTADEIAEASPGATILDGLAVEGQVAQKSPDRAKEAVSNWFFRLDIIFP